MPETSSEAAWDLSRIRMGCSRKVETDWKDRPVEERW
jgi:hypothetical protein